MLKSFYSMKDSLPTTEAKTIALSPSYFRFITEYTFSVSQTRSLKIGIVSVISLFLLALIFIQGVILMYHLREQQLLSQQRVQLQEEVQYWEKVADKYKGYRDVYYRIASLQYKLGNIAVSQQYVKKALDLDPNFPEGQVLGAKIGI